MASGSYRRSTRYPELFQPKASSRWWAFIPNPDGGRALRESTGHTDEVAAHRWYLDRVRQADPADAIPRITLEAALEKHIADTEARGRAAGTIDHYTKKSRSLIRLLGKDTPLDQVTAAIVDEFVRRRLAEPAHARKRSDGTVEDKGKRVTRSNVARELLVLRRSIVLARRLGFDAPDPALVMPIGFGGGSKAKKTRLNEKQVDLLLNALTTPNHRATTALIVALGATYPSELRDFTEANVLDRKKWIVHVKGTKRSTRDRKIPVPRFARRWLRIGLKDLPLKPWGSVRRDLAAACKRAGVPVVTPNDLRRTMGSILRARGAPPSLIGLYLGHGDSRMAERVYGHVTPEEMAALLGKLG